MQIFQLYFLLLLLPLLTPDIDCRRRRRETFFIHSPLLHDLIIFFFCSSLPQVLELHVCNLLLFLFFMPQGISTLYFFFAVGSLNFMCVIIIPNYYFSPLSLSLSLMPIPNVFFFYRMHNSLISLHVCIICSAWFQL